MSHKIMTQPLPAILDYIDEKIRELEEATRKAEVATGEARIAAEEARVAGEKAAGEARIAGEKASAEAAKEAKEAGIAAGFAAAQAAKAAVAEVRSELTTIDETQRRLIQSLSDELARTKELVVKSAVAVDASILAFKDKHVELSPVLKK